MTKIEYVESILNDTDSMTFAADDEDIFFDALTRIDENTLWEDVQTQGIVVHELVGHESIDCFEDAEAGQIADTLNNTGLYITVGGMNYLLGSSAVKSLQDRAQITGSGLTKLSTDDYADVLNRCLAVQSNQSRIMTRAGKVRFIASGDSKDYSVLPMSSLVSTTYDFISEHFGTPCFGGGHFDHTLTTASWKMPDMASELLDVYTKAAHAHGVDGTDNLIPAVKFASSDTGVSSVSLTAVLLGGTFPVYIGSAQKVKHRYEASIDKDYMSALNGLYASYRKQVERLADLTTIGLAYPVNALSRLAKKCRLPKKDTAEVINNYRFIFGSDPGTAHDVYMGLQEILFMNQHSNRAMNPRQRVVVEEDVAKCLSMTAKAWSDFDLAEGVEI